MKLLDLLLNQNVIVQLTWGEQKIEFPADVIEKDNESVYVTSYVHNGTELQLNITEGSGVICNVFADNSQTGQRISWRNVELTTVDKNGRILYCIKTRGFNNFANPDDRRYNERTMILVDGIVTDVYNGVIENITVRDISGVGVAFYAPETYSLKSQQVVVTFTDTIDEKIFDVKVECMISRTNIENGRTIVGCRLVGENRDYQLYRFIKHLKSKNGAKTSATESEPQITVPEENDKQEAANQSEAEDNTDSNE